MTEPVNRSKRQALRFSVEKYRLRFKTEFEDGSAAVENISAGGCSLFDLDVAVHENEKILIVLQCDEGKQVEIGGVVKRVQNGDSVAVQFLELGEEDEQMIVKFFATLLRKQKK